MQVSTVAGYSIMEKGIDNGQFSQVALVRSTFNCKTYLGDVLKILGQMQYNIWNNHPSRVTTSLKNYIESLTVLDKYWLAKWKLSWKNIFIFHTDVPKSHLETMLYKHADSIKDACTIITELNVVSHQGQFLAPEREKWKKTPRCCLTHRFTPALCVYLMSVKMAFCYESTIMRMKNDIVRNDAFTSLGSRECNFELVLNGKSSVDALFHGNGFVCVVSLLSAGWRTLLQHSAI